MVDRYRRNLVCPNYTPRKWWECDVFELTESGYFNEYEIKLTRSDFKADSKKIERTYNWQANEEKIRVKHELLAAGEITGPSRFFYVVPEGLITVEEVPAWAGLITCKVNHPARRFCVVDQVVKNAPRLHKQKADPKVVEHVRSIFYYRFMNHLLHRAPTDDQTEPVVDLNPSTETPEQKAILDAVFTEIQ